MNHDRCVSRNGLQLSGGGLSGVSGKRAETTRYSISAAKGIDFELPRTGPGTTYRPDFICFEKIIVELKAVSELGKEHKAQLFNYLKVSGLKLGLLVNFGHCPKAQIERIIL